MAVGIDTTTYLDPVHYNAGISIDKYASWSTESRVLRQRFSRGNAYLEISGHTPLYYNPWLLLHVLDNYACSILTSRSTPTLRSAAGYPSPSHSEYS